VEKRIRVVMVDDNDAVVGSVKKYFWSNAVIEVVKSFNNGKEGYEYLVENNDYDLVILDLLLPNMDGIKIIEELRKHDFDKKIIVLSSYKDEFTIRQVQQFKIDFYMLKPFSIESLEQRILDLFKKENLVSNGAKLNLEKEVTTILHGLGIPSHVRGYQYIREGILLIYDNPEKITMITKEVYPEIALRFDTTCSRVERAIRHAIEISWIRGDIKLMEDLFGHSIDIEKAKPTNSEFLNTIADHLKLSNKILIG